MPRSIERSAATVEAAVEAALAELGLTDQEARIDIIQEPKAGFLGVGGQEAVVRVSATTPEVQLDDLEEQADAVADFLDQLLAKMNIDAIAEPNPEGGQMYVDIVDGPEDDMALLIGRHGQTLEAIQELTRMIVGARLDERIRVIVDIGDYRKRRIARIQDHARELAEKVARTGQDAELEPMNPFERKLVHDAAAEIPGVDTASRGEEPTRYVVIRKR